MTQNIIIHLINDIEDKMYDRSEMVIILSNFADTNEFTSTSGSLWFKRMKDKGVIVPADSNKWSIKKDYII